MTYWKWRNDRRSERNLCNCVKKPEEKKMQDFNGVWTRDLAITGAMLYQLSYEATDVGSRSIAGSDILFSHFILGQASCWTVQLGFVQCHVPYAVYWLRAIPASGAYWTLAYAVQYDHRRDLLCCVHWYYVQFDHVYWFIGEALQWEGNATAVETQVIVLSILVWTETWTPQQSPK